VDSRAAKPMQLSSIVGYRPTPDRILSDKNSVNENTNHRFLIFPPLILAGMSVGACFLLRRR
jgi:hypothetical protein